MSNLLLELFVSESLELLEAAVSSLLQLEKQHDNADLINEAFRSVHTIKSSAAMFDFDAMTLIAATAEDLLAMLRAKELKITEAMTDTIFDSLDCVRTWVEYVDQHETLPDDAMETAQEYAANIRQHLAKTDTDKTKTEDTPIDLATMYLSTLLDSLTVEQRQQWFKEQQGNAFITFYYQPDNQCFYAGEDPFLLVRQLPCLEQLHIQPSQTLIRDNYDTYNCQLVFFGLSRASLEAVKAHFKAVADQVRIAQVVPLQLIQLQNAASTITPAWLGHAKQLIQENKFTALGSFLTEQLASVEADTRELEVLQWLLVVLDSPYCTSTVLNHILSAVTDNQPLLWDGFLLAHAKQPTTTKPEPPPIAILSDAEKAAYQHLIQQQINMLDIAIEPSLRIGVVRSIVRTVTNSLHYMQQPEKIPAIETAAQHALAQQNTMALTTALKNLLQVETCVSEATVMQPNITATSPQQETRHEHVIEKDSPSNKVLKVDQLKIDRLMDLIGELIVAKNSLPYLAKKADDSYGMKDIAKEIKEQYSVINRITDEMKDAIMQIRMLPVSQILKRFPRLVRDLSHDLGKQVELEVHGENTEVDKNLIELLSEPLIHIIRNSIDHGIETAEQRLATGKPAIGRISINAYQEQDKVVLDICDDGQGIDPEKIKEKVLQMGLLDAKRLASLENEDIIQFVFNAGLTTNRQVSNISGRGVGMDVVRSSVERLGGNVTLTSQLGKGTQIQLSLPLTMAVTRIMNVELNGQLFGIPMDMVVETLRIATQDICLVKHREMFLLREKIIPLFRLHQLLEMPEQVRDDEQGLAILVVRVFGELIGLTVDKFHGGIEIIQKPLEGIMSKLRNFSGTALLGDGSVLIVLNLKELLSCQ